MPSILSIIKIKSAGCTEALISTHFSFFFKKTFFEGMAFTLAGCCCCSVLSVQPQTVQRSCLPRTLGTSAKITATVFEKKKLQQLARRSTAVCRRGRVEPTQGHARTSEAHVVTSFFAVVQTHRTTGRLA